MKHFYLGRPRLTYRASHHAFPQEIHVDVSLTTTICFVYINKKLTIFTFADYSVFNCGFQI